MDIYEFAYLDEIKIQKILAQIDHGVRKKRVIRNTDSSSYEGKGGGGIPKLIEACGSLGKSSESLNEDTIENSPEGEFARFHEYLCSQSDFVQGTQDSISIENLPRHGLCEIDGVIQVPAIYQKIAQLFQIGSMHLIFNGHNVEVNETIQKMGHLFQTDKIPVTINNDEGKPVVLVVLYKRSLSIPQEEIEEEYSLLGKIIKVIKQGDPPYDLLKEIYNPKLSHNLPPTMLHQTLTTILELSDKNNGDPPTQVDFKLEGPLVVLSPIAIYR